MRNGACGGFAVAVPGSTTVERGGSDKDGIVLFSFVFVFFLNEFSFFLKRVFIKGGLSGYV